ncbi:MAG: hypothetical protein FWH48_09705 [Oscillospiraceae bacterium]|nr:hypothetical protein [Oscillospiraceae bacterium]
MITRQTLEIISICTVLVLMVVFATLYFVGTRRRKNLAAALKNPDRPAGGDDDFDMLAEQLRILSAQIELACELGPVFVVCYDYRRDCFYISENGTSQLGLEPLGGGGADQQIFESRIHEGDMSLYEEVTDFEDIRKREIADSPYIIRLKDASGGYGEYLMRTRPIYDEDGINKALVAAFINTEYIKKQ